MQLGLAMHLFRGGRLSKGASASLGPSSALVVCPEYPTAFITIYLHYRRPPGRRPWWRVVRWVAAGSPGRRPCGDAGPWARLCWMSICASAWVTLWFQRRALFRLSRCDFDLGDSPSLHRALPSICVCSTLKDMSRCPPRRSGLGARARARVPPPCVCAAPVYKRALTKSS